VPARAGLGSASRNTISDGGLQSAGWGRCAQREDASLASWWQSALARIHRSTTAPWRPCTPSRGPASALLVHAA